MSATTIREQPRVSWTTGRVLLVAIAALFAINIAFATVDRWTGGARPGPPSSTFTTADDGLAAYADLLQAQGRSVDRLREPLADTTLDPSSTLFVLDASLDDTDAAALSTFVRSGGHLVTGGAASGWLRSVLSRPPSWELAPAGAVTPVAPAPEVSGVGQVVSSGPGVWSDTGEALPVLAGPRGTLLAVSSVGAGRVALLATGAPLHNRLLDDADNAALGVALAGDSGRAVVFAEYPHGFAQGQGIRAIPVRARWAMGGLALAALLWMAGRARRLGPPEESSRALPPPRRAYVEALAATLAKTRRRADAVASVQRVARERVTRLTGVKPGSDPQAWRTAAARIGIDETEADALIGAATDDDAVIEAGRALAKLEAMNP